MQHIKVKRDECLILVDASYYIFHRYFATLRWYKYKVPDVNCEKIHEDEEFVTAFKKHVHNDIRKWQKSWNFRNNIIFCLDCPRAEIWRMELFPEYKGARVQSPTFNPNIFTIFYELMDNELKNIGIQSVSGEKLEADDVVYLLIERLRNIDESYMNRIIVLTNDNDYLQMKTDSVDLYNLHNKDYDISKRGSGDPKMDLMIKILMGDISDNIPAVAESVGKVTAEKIARMSENERKEWIEKKGKSCHDAYERNRKLISFECIPKDLIKKFNENCIISVKLK